jgi:hypothetical protein
MPDKQETGDQQQNPLNTQPGREETFAKQIGEQTRKHIREQLQERLPHSDPVKEGVEKIRKEVLGDQDADPSTIEPPQPNAETKPELGTEVELDKKTKGRFTDLKEFLAAEKALITVREKDLKKRYGKLWRMKAWLGGDFDWQLTQNGEIKKRAARIITTRKFASAFLNRRGLILLGSVIVTAGTGGTLAPALGALLGGAVGWGAADRFGKEKGTQNELSQNQKELMQVYLDTIVEMLPELREESKTKTESEMAEFINSAANKILEKTNEQLEEKHSRITVLKDQLDKKKSKWFTWGSLTGLAAGGGYVLASMFIQAKAKLAEQIIKNGVEYGQQNFDKTLTNVPYPQDWLNLTHNVIEKGGKFFHVIRTEDIAMAHQMGWQLTTEQLKAAGQSFLIHAKEMALSPAQISALHFKATIEITKLLVSQSHLISSSAIALGASLFGPLYDKIGGRLKKRIANIKESEQAIELEHTETEKQELINVIKEIIPEEALEELKTMEPEEAWGYAVTLLEEYGPEKGISDPFAFLTQKGLIKEEKTEKPITEYLLTPIMAKERVNLPRWQVGQFYVFTTRADNVIEPETRIIKITGEQGQEYYQAQFYNLSTDGTTLVPTEQYLLDKNQFAQAARAQIKTQDQRGFITLPNQTLERLQRQLWGQLAGSTPAGRIEPPQTTPAPTQPEAETQKPEIELNPKESGTDTSNQDELSRAVAQAIIFHRIKDVRELNADNLAEGQQKFIEKTQEVWNDLVIHSLVFWKENQEGQMQLYIRAESDLDGIVCLNLFKQAGLDTSAVRFVKPGDLIPGATHADTGNVNGFGLDPKNGTWVMDHHTANADNEHSASHYVHQTLLSLNSPENPKAILLENSEELKQVIAFVNQADNLNYSVGDQNYYVNELPQTLFGLYRFITAGIRDFRKRGYEPSVKLGNPTFEQLLQFFKDGHKPDMVYPQEVWEQYGFIRKNEQGKKIDLIKIQKRNNREAIRILEEINQAGFIVDSPHGRIVIDLNGRVSGRMDAAKAYGCSVYIGWQPKTNSFFISSVDPLPQNFNLNQGIPMRQRMWLQPENYEEKEKIFTDLLVNILQQLQVANPPSAEAIEQRLKTLEEKKAKKATIKKPVEPKTAEIPTVAERTETATTPLNTEETNPKNVPTTPEEAAPALEGEVTPEPTPTAPPVAEEIPAFKASIPIMITQQMRTNLQAAGVTTDEIANMTPEQAWQRLENVRTLSTAAPAPITPTAETPPAPEITYNNEGIPMIEKPNESLNDWEDRNINSQFPKGRFKRLQNGTFEPVANNIILSNQPIIIENQRIYPGQDMPVTFDKPLLYGTRYRDIQVRLRYLGLDGQDNPVFELTK